MKGHLPEVVDRLIADHVERALPSITRRRAALVELPGKADVVVGMRRSGKTFRLLQHLEDLAQRGIPRQRTLYLDFEDERLLPMNAEDLALVPEAFYRRFPENRRSPCWFLFDEVQNVAGWERFVRRLIDTEAVRLVVTGSSAKLLASEIATSLRGRSLSTELLPFSFAEALAHAGISVPERWPPASAARSRLGHAFERYLETGGFPEVQGLSAETRTRVLQEYLDVVLFRDIVERHQVGNTVALRAFVRRVLRSCGLAFSVNRVYGDLRSQGVEVSKDALHAFVGHIEDAFLAFTVRLDARSEHRKAVNPRHVYLVDHALARAVAPLRAEDVGHYLENIVYLELRRRGGEIAYHRTRSGREVDFVVHRDGEVPALIQVCATLRDTLTRDRELAALGEAMTELGAAEAMVVTLWEEEVIDLAGSNVRIVPAWRWLLEPSKTPARSPGGRRGSAGRHRSSRPSGR